MGASVEQWGGNVKSLRLDKDGPCNVDEGFMAITLC